MRPRSACGVRGVSEVAVLSLVSGSAVALEMVAVLVRVPVAVEASVPVSTTVAEAPGARASSPQVTALPAPTVQVQPAAPAAASGVADSPLTVAGTVSASRGASAADGPSLVTVMLHVTVSPGTAVPVRFLVTRRSADGAVGVEVVEELLAATGSFVGELTVAVFTRLPVWVAARVPLMVTRMDAPEGSVAAAHPTFWPVTVQDQPAASVAAVMPVTVLGITSDRVGVTAVEGPLLVMVTVQLTPWPGTAGLGEALDLTASRSARETVGVAEVALLLVWSGSDVAVETVAVLLSSPVCVCARVPRMVSVTVVPGARLAAAQSTCCPVTVHVHPVAVVVAVRPVTSPSTTSWTARSAAVEGPVLVTVSVHVTGWPATAGLGEAPDLVIPTLALGEVGVMTVLELFSGAASGVTVVAVAVLERGPVKPGVSVPEITKLRLAAGASVAVAQATSWPDTEQLVPAGTPLTATPFTPAGTASVVDTVVAVDVPALVTLTRQLTV